MAHSHGLILTGNSCAPNAYRSASVPILSDKALGHTAAEYDAWLIKIGDGDQFGSGFVTTNPNSKRPALLTLLLLRWNGRTFSYASSWSANLRAQSGTAFSHGLGRERTFSTI
jgi:hypothetical protein